MADIHQGNIDDTGLIAYIQKYYHMLNDYHLKAVNNLFEQRATIGDYYEEITSKLHEPYPDQSYGQPTTHSPEL